MNSALPEPATEFVAIAAKILGAARETAYCGRMLWRH